MIHINDTGGGNTKKQVPDKTNTIIYELVQDKNALILIDKYIADQLYTEEGSFTDQEVDIRIYLEDATTDNLFGTICYVSINRSLEKYLNTRDSFRSPENLAKRIVKHQFGDKGNKTIEKLLRAAIEYEIESEHDTEEGFFYQQAGAFLQWLAETFRKEQSGRNRWDPADKNYDPILSSGSEDSIVAGWKAVKVATDKLLSSMESFAGRAEKIKIIGGLFAGVIRIVKNIFSGFIEAIDTIVDIIREIGDLIKTVNAFICGLLSGCFEFCAGLIDMVALLLKLSQKLEGDKVKEAVENLVADVLNNPGRIVAFIKQLFEKLKERYANDPDPYSMGFKLGEDVFELLLWVDIIAAALKLLKKIPKGFEALEAWVKKSGAGLPEGTQRASMMPVDLRILYRQMKALYEKFRDMKVLKEAWEQLNPMQALKDAEIKELMDIQEIYCGVKSIDNVATLKVVIDIKGEIKELFYQAISGFKNNPQNFCSSPNKKYIADVLGMSINELEELFLTKAENGVMERFNDTEHKVLAQFDKDITILKSVHGVENIKIKEMKFKTLLEPCDVCKKQIIIREQLLNIEKITVQATKIDKFGYAQKGKDLLKLKPKK